MNQKKEGLSICEPSDFDDKKWIYRFFSLTLIFGFSIFAYGGLISDSMASGFSAQKASKSKGDKPKETISSSEHTTEFIPPYPFSTDEFVLNLGEVLSSEDGRTTRETVERAFNVKFSDKPVKDADRNYPNMSRFYLRPRVDWYFGMGRGCKKLCVNGHFAGNCVIAWSNDNDRRQKAFFQ